MRAFLSDTHEQRANIVTFDSLPRTGRADEQPGDVWALAAEREARAILAVTEPETPDTDLAPPNAHFWRFSGNAALAESLAAFIADDDEPRGCWHYSDEAFCTQCDPDNY